MIEEEIAANIEELKDDVISTNIILDQQYVLDRI